MDLARIGPAAQGEDQHSGTRVTIPAHPMTPSFSPSQMVATAAVRSGAEPRASG
jgi:hypothetical protein